MAAQLSKHHLLNNPSFIHSAWNTIHINVHSYATLASNNIEQGFKVNCRTTKTKCWILPYAPLGLGLNIDLQTLGFVRDQFSFHISLPHLFRFSSLCSFSMAFLFIPFSDSHNSHRREQHEHITSSSLQVVKLKLKEYTGLEQDQITTSPIST